MVNLQVSLAQEQSVAEETKANTMALTEMIGQEKAAVDEAMEAGREHEEAIAKLQVRHACVVQFAINSKAFCILHLLSML